MDWQVLRQGFWRAWAFTRHILSIRGLLDWLGWKKPLGAALISLVVGAWAFIRGESGPVITVLGLFVFALVVVAWRSVTFKENTQDESEDLEKSGPHAPLVFASYAPLKEGQVFMQIPWNLLDITAVYVKNIQVSPPKGLRNVRARVEYLHDGVPDFVVERACWWASYPRARGISNADTIDLESNEEQAVPVFMISTAKEGTQEQYTLKWPQSAAFNGWNTRNLGLGRWTLRIAISADFCQPLKGEVEFTILEDHPSGKIMVGTLKPYGFTRLPVENPTW